MKKSETISPAAVLPQGRPFRIVCAVEQADQFEADFLGAYGDMLYDRARVKRQTYIALAVCAVLSAVVLFSPEIIDAYLWFTVGFALLFALYGWYFCSRGYKNDYRNLQKHLERAVDAGNVIYETEQITYDFQDTGVFLTYGEGVTRQFLYSDIRWIEQTGRQYLFGMRYLPREKRLAGFERALFPKRYLDAEKTQKLETLIANITAAYTLEVPLKEHPFQ